MTTAALIFLITSLIVLGLGVSWAMLGPGRYTLSERLLYAPVYALSRILWRVELEWVESEPTANAIDGESRRIVPTIRDRDRLLADRIKTGAVLVANHRCSLDPFFLQLIAGTRVHWMVAGEYFKTPLVGNLLRAFQAIPTNRGGVDTASTKRAIASAKQGRFVGMFPEGRINR
ncbi:MAG: 1-acyl-sn-glycerol-3-phosphate acyltransferase, partial [Planctomycetes bacterium]|nr:1-acyl-sn-glycerol-3-phosphate acyltransferase [Planctomycetota bacterium]